MTDARSPVRRDVLVVGGEGTIGGNEEGVEGATGGKRQTGSGRSGLSRWRCWMSGWGWRSDELGAEERAFGF